MEVLKMKNAFVYWIKKPTHNDIKKQGYIGVARNVEKRLYRHKRLVSQNKHENHFLQEVLLDGDTLVEIIFCGQEKDCYEKEKELRPNYMIGWNIVPGGHGGSTSLGMRYSDEFRKKRSEIMMGNQIAKGNHKPKSEEHRKKISQGNIGRIITDEQKKKQSEKMKMKKQTPESNEKRRLALLGKKRGPYKKKYNELVV